MTIRWQITKYGKALLAEYGRAVAEYKAMPWYKRLFTPAPTLAQFYSPKETK